MTTNKALQDMIAKLKAARKAETTEVVSVVQAIQQTMSQVDKYGNTITLNERQQEIVKLIASGKNAILVGAAGTGKSTSMRTALSALLDSGKVGILTKTGHKHLIDNTPGVIICAYTRRAVSNIRKMLSKDLQRNCITIHKLLEYEPEKFEIVDDETGEVKTTMRFVPNRTYSNPLPSSISAIIFEESSMIGTDLYWQVREACPHKPQEVFLGDIQQLVPVFGPAILGFKMQVYPIVELTDVYRQALESPIIRLAHRILSGEQIKQEDYANLNEKDKLHITPWKKRVHADVACITAGNAICSLIDAGKFDVEQDTVLIPFNKGFGSDDVNARIATHLAKKRGAYVTEVIAGYNKHYYSVGDKVMYEKEDATIVEILPNLAYTGKKPRMPARELDYFGTLQTVENTTSKDTDISEQISEDDMELLLTSVSMSEDRVRQGSHIIKLKLPDSDDIIEVTSASAINALSLGYAMTVHKSQGSEWRKVILLLHQSHATMVQRELLYTAVTRAKESLIIICESDSLIKGVENARIKGVTIAEKAEFFKGKLKDNEDYAKFLD